MSTAAQQIRFITPQDFDKKYKGLSLETNKSFYGGRSTHTVVLAKKDPYSWADLVSMAGSLQISELVKAKYPDFESDLLSSKPYYDIWIKNMSKNYCQSKPATPKAVKPFLLKAEQVKKECDLGDPRIYEYRKNAHDFKTEAEILNVVIEVSKDCGIETLEKCYENVVEKIGHDEVKTLARVNFTFKTAKTTGKYEICLLERSTGFIKLLLKYLDDSYNLIW